MENEILDTWTAEEVEQYVALTERFLVDMRARVEELRGRKAREWNV